MESIGITNFWTFLLAGLLLNLTPGTDTMYILGRSMSHGVKAGVFSAFGISTGSLLHTLAAATGLSLVLATSATAFTVVKYCGAGYLVYLGVRMFFSSHPTTLSQQQEMKAIRYNKLYFAGVLTNVLNPKVALFFLAFLPQFIDPDYPYPVFSFLALGATFIVTGTFWCLLLAVYSAKFSVLLQKNNCTSGLLDKLSGVLFVGLGIKLAFVER